MLDEALGGLHLPEIINTKIMEHVTINGKAQEVYGKIIRDTVLRWRGSWMNSTLADTIEGKKPEGFNHIIFQNFIKQEMDFMGVSPKGRIKTGKWKLTARLIHISHEMGLSDERVKQRIAKWMERMDELIPGGADLTEVALNKYEKFSSERKEMAIQLWNKLRSSTQGGGRFDVERMRQTWIDIRRAFKSLRKKI